MLRWKHNLNKGQAWKFIKKAFSEDVDRTEERIDFANWLGMPPHENVIRKQLPSFPEEVL